MAFKAKILTVSDSVISKTRKDASGPALAAHLEKLGLDVIDISVVEDGIEPVSRRLKEMTSGFSGLVLTTGGTGFGPRDLTPEATSKVVERFAPGLAETIRSSSPLGALSRGVAGSIGSCLIINLPGSVSGATESVDFIAPLLPHALALLAGDHPIHPTPESISGHDPKIPSSHAQERELTHIDGKGHAHMVDVSDKPLTHRLARATCRILMPKDLKVCIPPDLEVLEVFAQARIAGIQGAKLTSSLIPLCHPLSLSTVSVDIQVDSHEIIVCASAETVERTGVEMEALTACSMAALMIVGTCSQISPPPTIQGLTLLEKLGGRSGHWRNPKFGDYSHPGVNVES